MAYRIVERSYADNQRDYVVETNRIFFNMIPWKWHIVTYPTFYEFADSWWDTKKAIFPTLEEAEYFINGNPIIKKRIISIFENQDKNHEETNDNN